MVCTSLEKNFLVAACRRLGGGCSSSMGRRGQLCCYRRGQSAGAARVAFLVFKLARTFSPGDIVVYWQVDRRILARVTASDPADFLAVQRANQPPRKISACRCHRPGGFNTRPGILVAEFARHEQSVGSATRTTASTAENGKVRMADPTNPNGQANDMQAYLNRTQQLVRQRKYREASDRFVWFDEHALEHDPGMSGVRLSFALSYWKDLGDVYPPAKQAMVDMRDRKTWQLWEGRGNVALFSDVAALNRTLNENANPCWRTWAS